MNRHYNICEATTLTCILAGRVRSGSADSDRTCRPSHPACIDIRLASHTDCSPLLHGQHTFNRWRMVVSGTWKNDNPRLKLSHEGAARVWHFQPRVVIYPRLTNDCVSYVLSYGQIQESWIISGLQWRNVNEYRLPSKNAHSPNYCLWLAVCVNNSANFYCKIALINRFKLYLIKTYSKTPKKTKKTNRK